MRLLVAAATAVGVSLLLYLPDRNDGSGAILGGLGVLIGVALALAPVAKFRPLPQRSPMEHLHWHSRPSGLALPWASGISSSTTDWRCGNRPSTNRWSLDGDGCGGAQRLEQPNSRCSRRAAPICANLELVPERVADSPLAAERHDVRRTATARSENEVSSEVFTDHVRGSFRMRRTGIFRRTGSVRSRRAIGSHTNVSGGCRRRGGHSERAFQDPRDLRSGRSIERGRRGR